jgi:hypothetical protein
VPCRHQGMPRAIRNRTPVGKLFVRLRTGVPHLHVFGTVVYSHIPNKLGNKVGPLCQKGSFACFEANMLAHVDSLFC